MGDSPLTLLYGPLLLLLLLVRLPTSSATLHRAKLFVSEESENRLDTTPTTFFEVTRPIPVPETEPCSALILQHDFAFTYGHPPVTAPYLPPSHCRGVGHQPSRIVLEWSAACRGVQFDRIFGVWLGGAEILRSCTAEPTASGIFWTVRKDVTRYAPLLSRPQTLSVYLGNLVDQTYTGVYHVNVTLHFYYPAAAPAPADPLPGFSSPADLILPISRPAPGNDGLWFTIQSSTDVQSAELVIPSNTYRAVLEVYLSYHSHDEFWYSNPPNSYISANNLTSQPGNGPFREVTASLDGNVVGAVWPFTVIYTGGFNPLLWRPITGIGSFDLPSYDIEITPFLGKLLDGKPHSFGFGVTNALDFWYVDANLHLWLDSKSSQTVGALILYEAPNPTPSLVSKFAGRDGHFNTSASREISSTGWVNSSYGNITTHFFQSLHYKNWMEFTGEGSIQAVNQSIDFNYGTDTNHPSSEQSFQSFPLYLYTGTTADQANNTYSLVTNVSLGFNTNKLSGGRFVSSLTDSQNAESIVTVKGNTISRGSGSTQQGYRYESTDGCYFRRVSSRNYNILTDQSGNSCTRSGSPLGSENGD